MAFRTCCASRLDHIRCSIGMPLADASASAFDSMESRTVQRTCNQREIYQSPACIYNAIRDLSINRRDVYTKQTSFSSYLDLLAQHLVARASHPKLV